MPIRVRRRQDYFQRLLIIVNLVLAEDRQGLTNVLSQTSGVGKTNHLNWPDCKVLGCRHSESEFLLWRETKH